MTEFVTELGKQVTQKWLDLLVLPGLLYVATIAVALAAGQDHALDTDRLWRIATGQTERLGNAGWLAILVLGVGLLLASAAAGLLAQAVAAGVHQLWLGLWPGPLRRWADRVAAGRARRWVDACAAIERAAEAPPDGRSEAERAAALSALAAARNQISGAMPRRPTWIGDRMSAAAEVLRVNYGLDLDAAWPRLWLVVPAEVRTEIRAARAAFDRSGDLAAWGVLYLLLGPVWWPALLPGTIVFLIGWARARVRVAVLADLVEAAVDIHLSDLAAAVDRGAGSVPPARLGADLNSLFRKGR